MLRKGGISYGLTNVQPFWLIMNPPVAPKTRSCKAETMYPGTLVNGYPWGDQGSEVIAADGIPLFEERSEEIRSYSRHGRDREMGRAHLIHLTPHLREVKYPLEAIRDPMPNVMRVPDSQLKKGNLRASTS